MGFVLLLIQYNTNKFLTRSTCQFASESVALWWRQKQLRVARFKQFSFKPVLKMSKTYQLNGRGHQESFRLSSGCPKRSRCRWYSGWLLLKVVTTSTQCMTGWKQSHWEPSEKLGIYVFKIVIICAFNMRRTLDNFGGNLKWGSGLPSPQSSSDQWCTAVRCCYRFRRPLFNFASQLTQTIECYFRSTLHRVFV